MPTAIVATTAIVLLGPTLARLALPERSLAYWPELQAGRAVRPEGTEQARYLIALAAPLLLVALARLLLVTRRVTDRAAADARLARAAEWTLPAAVAGCLVAQWTYVFHYAGQPDLVVHYFSAATLAAAAGIAAAVAFAARAPRARAAWERRTRETRGRAIAGWGLAVATVVVAMLPVLQTDGGIAAADNWVVYHLQFPYDETVAVLDGRSPLGNFAAQYSSLWPYALAGGMRLLGDSLTVFTLQLAVLAGLMLLASFALLRRVVHSSLGALPLFLPLLATSGFRLGGSGADRFSLVNYVGVLPMRYAGPFVLAWLLARQLDGARPRRAWSLFLVAGLTLLNNADFGFAALAALGAALVAVQGARRRVLLELAREAAAGLAAALALVAALLLARTGSPPDLALLTRYATVYAGGFSLVPIRPVLGVGTLLYLTFAGAIGVAAVRALGGAGERVLTGLLMWSGVFGLGAGIYYVGESSPEKLLQQFPSWALAVTLLAIVAIRRIARRPGGAPSPAELVCLFALGLLVCSLPQLPAPWQQVRRVARHGGVQLYADPPGVSFVARQTRAREPVLILTTLGHRVAVEAGVDDVEPYTGTLSIQTEEQLADSVGALRAAGGTKLFVMPAYGWASQLQALHDRFGFQLSTEEPGYHIQMWVRH